MVYDDSRFAQLKHSLKTYFFILKISFITSFVTFELLNKNEKEEEIYID